MVARQPQNKKRQQTNWLTSHTVSRVELTLLMIIIRDADGTETVALVKTILACAARKQEVGKGQPQSGGEGLI